ncbi:TSC22 domain family protein 1 isoform X2 [Anolis carolinensis]|uniref:TSC22 domain family protein 1 isoform X2 n=1 Tax=Anolis carolinensis TaxID=28377 RepID=UPI002F2B2BBC
MHHQPDSAADSPSGGRKMAHPAMLPRRGSSGSSGVAVVGPALGGGTLEDLPPPPAASSSSAGPQGPPPPPPPQSLSLVSQPVQMPLPLPPAGQAGAQMKKKSGFQITSVTPAQISASLSSNNSIAEDTESYDDLDESHTEDLSSSEILDVSLSRATDLGEPERSSSEETLNNFQEAESPGAVSPNQPGVPQQQPAPALPHAPQQQGMAMNGSVHPPHGHHFHHHHHHHHHGHHHSSHSGAAAPSSPSFRKLSAAGSTDGAAATVATVPVSAASSTVATTISHFRAAGVPSAGGATTGTFGSVASGGPSMVSSVPPGHVNKNLSNIPSTGGGTALPVASGSVNVAVLSGVSNGTSASSGNSSNPVAGAVPSHLQPTASTSRFRVVKLDSSSEPFKKGRWTCTEFYDKENPASLTEGVAAVNKAVDTLKQNPLEGTSERESTSGSSVSSNVSTLSHYTESVGSGEMGAAPTVMVQQQQAFQGADFSTTGPQGVPAPSMPQSISQSQLAQAQLHPQDVNYSQLQQGVQPPPSAVPPPVNIVGGHQQPAMAASQQLPYTQQSSQPVQAVPVVPQPHQLPYGQGQAQHPVPPQQMPMQMAPGHIQPVNQNSVPDYMQQQQQQQQQQQMVQTPASSMQTGPPVVGTGTPVPVAQAPSVQPSVQAHLAVASSQPVAHAQTTMQTIGANAQMMNVGPQASVPPVVPQQPPVTNQITPQVMAQNTAPPPSQAVPPVAAGMIHPGQQGSTSSLSQPLVIAPQSTLLQAAESLVQGLAGQLPPVSPIPSVSAVPAPCHPSANVPAAPMSLATSKNLAQSSGVQNGNLVQNVSQPSLISTSINLPIAPNLSAQMPLNSAQFSAQSLAHAVASRAEEARRSTEPTLIGLPQLISGDGGGGASSSISDGGSSMASSLFPLKVLPLTSQLVDGEDERYRMTESNIAQ